MAEVLKVLVDQEGAGDEHPLPPFINWPNNSLAPPCLGNSWTHQWKEYEGNPLVRGRLQSREQTASCMNAKTWQWHFKKSLLTESFC